MKTVKKFEFPTSTFGESKHDWSAILAAKVDRDALGKPGPAVLLVHGDDFTSDPDLFVGSIRTNAAKRHLKAKVSKVDNDGVVSLYVQCCDMNDEEIATADARAEKAKETGKARLAKKRDAAKVTPTVHTAAAG